MSQESAPRSDQAGLLPALHRLQDQLGYIPDHAVADLVRTYNVSRAEVEGVIGFYHDFRRTPPGRRRLQICRAESCQAMGADALAAHASGKLGVGFGATTADGAITLEAAYCLGNCACSPALMLDGRLYGRIDAERLDELLAEGGAA
ncbi:MAG: formate dehydrogenase subunit gamma [Hydrogenophilales bacterium 17-64-11]|nr:MAG: formate dehydrogenase subunit gamma [Hydrogenophilales bacterium 17-64-11]